MVAIIEPGETIRGILNYNENKVKEGKAVCLNAVGFGCEASELTFSNKWHRFRDIIARHKSCETNALHITINFHPDEIISADRLNQIAESYMDKIGFGHQPYLVYQHFDAGHPHLHIATTNIEEDGNRIDTHLIGKLKSNPARKEIEIEYRLLKAEGRKSNQHFVLRPADLEKASYGKAETKAQISNIVRSVVKHYKYSSLQELNAVLGKLNVIADRGELGTLKYERKGLTYHLLNDEKEKIGVPIKASSIYDNPILKNLEARYEHNTADKGIYKARVIDRIDEILGAGANIEEFERKMDENGIWVVWSKNEAQQIYGITFVDTLTHCVFKGSDLAKGYGAKGILENLVSGTSQEINENRELAGQVIPATDFKGGIAQVMALWAAKDLVVLARNNLGGFTRYRLGKIGNDPNSFIPADKRMNTYFKANGLTAEMTARASTEISQLRRNWQLRSDASGHGAAIPVSEIAGQYFAKIFSIVFDTTYTSNHVPSELLEELKKKKKRRR